VPLAFFSGTRAGLDEHNAALSDDPRGVVATYGYDVLNYMPFGEELLTGTGSRSATMKYGAADGLKQKFTSKQRDTDSGLDYFGARYYSSLFALTNTANARCIWTPADGVLLIGDNSR
jgi:hypothetical protein